MMSKDAAVIWEKKDGVANITINRPEQRNPISREVQELIISILDEIRNDNTVNVVTTTGAGDKAWSAGMNLSDLKYLYDHPEALETFPNATKAIRDFPKVTIAVVNGYCLGAAMTLMCAHDLAIASEENARFGLPEIFRNFVPKWAPAPLIRTTHTKWAFEMMLTGKNWDAKRAYQAGLINKVVRHSQLTQAAKEWAEEITQLDPIVLKYCKRAGYAVEDATTYDQAIDICCYNWGLANSVNPKAFKGVADFIGGKGMKADK